MLTLRDPNIVRVLGVFQRDDCPGVVIEYLQGSLRQYLLNSEHEEDDCLEDDVRHHRLVRYVVHALTLNMCR